MALKFKIKTNPLSFILGIIVIALPLFPASTSGNIFYGLTQITYTVYGTAALLTAILLNGLIKNLRGKRNTVVGLNLIDAAILLYISWGILNLIFVRSLQFDPLLLIKWLALGLLYVLARGKYNPAIIRSSFIASGCLQSIIAISQFAGYVASKHMMFDVTGTFGNPGPLGGYLAITFLISLSGLITAIKNKNARWQIIAYILCALLIGAGVVLSGSRAALLAAIGGLVYLIYNKVLPPQLSRLRYSIGAALTVIVIASSFALFHMRPGSAEARLLTWRVSADMIMEKPVLGHGAGTFADKYMSYQGDYFRQNPDSKYAMVADNPIYPYNEMIHLLVEQGVIALIIFGILFCLIFFGGWTQHEDNISIKAALLGLLIFSMFSYPSDIFPLMASLIILMAGLRYPALLKIKTGVVMSCISVVLLCGIIIGTYKTQSVYHEVSDRLTATLNASKRDNMAFTADDFALFKHNINFRIWYLEAMSNNKSLTSEAIEQMDEIATTSYDSCLEFGRLLMYSGDFQKTREYLTMASYMIPNRMKPNYYLWELSMKKNDYADAVKYAEKIVTQKIKVSNTFTIRVRTRMEKFLEETAMNQGN